MSTEDQNKPRTFTPEEREALKRRMAEFKACMDVLNPTINPENMSQWVELYNERDAIDKQLGDDS